MRLNGSLVLGARPRHCEAQQRPIDVVLVHKPDRFSRNVGLTLEHFEKLSNWGVSFTSINENMDFSSPWGRLALTLLGGLAQFYSDNLGLEVKKGKSERKAQGLYNGLLPFGVKRDEDGIPVSDPDTPGSVDSYPISVHSWCHHVPARGYSNCGSKQLAPGDGAVTLVRVRERFEGTGGSD